MKERMVNIFPKKKKCNCENKYDPKPFKTQPKNK